MLGTKRIIKKFAWIPKKIFIGEDDYIIWLEYYNSYQRYDRYQNETFGECVFHWVEYSSALIKNI